MTYHFVITLNYKNKLQSENHLSSKETADMAANQAILVKQAKTICGYFSQYQVCKLTALAYTD